jgi:predicted protein tyrosine phosphatase
VLISVRDPDKPRVQVPRSPLCKAILELAFHDAEPVEDFSPSQPITYMTQHDDAAIWAFLRKHDGQYGLIVVQCEQGMGRSPAIGAGLAAGLGLDETRFWRDYQLNRYVYKLVRDAAGPSGLAVGSTTGDARNRRKGTS